MNTKMPASIRSQIQELARSHRWTVDEKHPGVDQYVKLITLRSSKNSKCLFIDKVTGFSSRGDLRYFKVAIRPDLYDPNLETLPGVSAAINNQSKKNQHSHSGYVGCPVVPPHDEPCAKAYKVKGFDALEEILRSLNR
jgi:hypothetical protein